MTRETAQFLFDMLNKQVVPVNDPNFLLIASMANTAKTELEKVIEESMSNNID